MKIYSHGGADEVTGSRHYLDTGTSIIQVDCGAFNLRKRKLTQRAPEVTLRAWIKK